MRRSWEIADAELLGQLRDEARRAPVRERRRRLVVDLRGAPRGGPRMLVVRESSRYRVDEQLGFIFG
jgi:hypothetical protein